MPNKLRNWKHTINSYHKLKKDWDTYGGNPPEPEQLARAIEFLEILNEVPTMIAPVSNGGCFFEFKTKTGFCEVTIADIDVFFFVHDNGRYTNGDLNMLLKELW